jgi:hypothetical protein
MKNFMAAWKTCIELLLALITICSLYSLCLFLSHTLSVSSFCHYIIQVRRTGKLLEKSRCTPHIGRGDCSTTTAPIYSGSSSSRRPTKYTL